MLRANARIDQRHNWDSVWCVLACKHVRPLRVSAHSRTSIARPRPPTSPLSPVWVWRRARRWEWILDLRGILYYSREAPGVPGYRQTVYLLGERRWKE
jgi:hypothetical protein